MGRIFLPALGSQKIIIYWFIEFEELKCSANENLVYYQRKWALCNQIKLSCGPVILCLLSIPHRVQNLLKNNYADNGGIWLMMD